MLCQMQGRCDLKIQLKSFWFGQLVRTVVVTSVTRYGEKYHFGIMLKVFGNSVRVYLDFGKIFETSLAKFVCYLANFEWNKWSIIFKNSDLVTLAVIENFLGIGSNPHRLGT